MVKKSKGYLHSVDYLECAGKHYWRDSCAILRVIVLSIMVLSSPAAAQDAPGIPPVQTAIDPNGVDLLTMSLTGQTDPIGPSNSSLTFSNSIIELGWRPSLHVKISCVNDVIQLQNRSIAIIPPYFGNPTMSLRANTGDRLEVSESQYVLIERDGTRTVFDRGSFLDGYPDGACGIATSITRPSGEVLTFFYKRTPGTGVFANDIVSQLKSVNSNFGYQIKFEYYQNQGFYNPSRSTFINNAVEYCDPIADTCQLLRTWPSIFISRTYNPTPSAGAYIAIDEVDSPAKGREVYTWRQEPNGPILSYRRPGSSADTSTVVTDQYGVPLSSTRDGVTYTYNKNADYSVTITDSAGGSSRTQIGGCSNPIGSFCGVVSGVTDPVGRTSTYTYDQVDRMTRATRPEGDYTEYVYDDRGNVVSETVVAKPASGVATITRLAAFPSTCDNPVTCNKPLWTRDAAGGQTDYTYDAVHGGVLTRTGPSGANGIRPQTRYSYAQRYAWISNGAAGFVHAGGAIWLMVEERTCRTTSTVGGACDGGAADEVVNTYDYGPDTGAVGNTLLLRGLAVAADNQVQRTCYGYDAETHRVSETRPRAGVAACY